MVPPHLWRSVSSSLLKYVSDQNVFKANTNNNNPTPMNDHGDKKPNKFSDVLPVILARLNPIEKRLVRIPYSNKFCFVFSEKAQSFLSKHETVENRGLKILPALSSEAILTERIAKKLLDAMGEGLMLDKGYKINGAMSETCFENKQEMKKQSGFIWKAETRHLNGKEWGIYVAETVPGLGWCVGSGQIVVTSIPSSQDVDDDTKEAVIATLLAHELGHAIAKHTSRDSTNRQFGGVLLLGCVFKFDGKTLFLLWPVIYLLLTLFHRYISRRHEAEADYISLMLMASAGYDPAWVPAFYKAFNSKLKHGLFSTHYSHEKRFRLLMRDKVIDEARKIYKDVVAGKGVTRFV